MNQNEPGVYNVFNHQVELRDQWTGRHLVVGIILVPFLFSSRPTSKLARSNHKPGLWCWRRGGCGVHFTTLFQYRVLKLSTAARVFWKILKIYERLRLTGSFERDRICHGHHLSHFQRAQEWYSDERTQSHVRFPTVEDGACDLCDLFRGSSKTMTKLWRSRWSWDLLRELFLSCSSCPGGVAKWLFAANACEDGHSFATWRQTLPRCQHSRENVQNVHRDHLHFMDYRMTR